MIMNKLHRFLPFPFQKLFIDKMESGMQKDDTFTITGVRSRKDGTFTKRCKKGNEDVFTVVETET